MISIYWGFCAYVMFPTACISLFLMLSNLGPLERLGCRICCADIRVGSFRCSVMVLMVVLALLGFLASVKGVERYERLREDGVKHVSLDDRYKLQLFRDQRNWWISGCNLILWLVCWRVQAMMRKKELWLATGGAPGGGAKAAGAAGGSAKAGTDAAAGSPTTEMPEEPKKEK